jgi:hypothetical protein
VFERLEWIRWLLGGGGLGVVCYQLSKGVRTAMVERSRRKTTLAIMDRLIERERQLGQPAPPLAVVRPPPDQLDPLPPLGDLAQLQVERQPGDHRDPGAARG